MWLTPAFQGCRELSILIVLNSNWLPRMFRAFPETLVYHLIFHSNSSEFFSSSETIDTVFINSLSFVKLETQEYTIQWLRESRTVEIVGNKSKYSNEKKKNQNNLLACVIAIDLDQVISETEILKWKKKNQNNLLACVTTAEICFSFQ